MVEGAPLERVYGETPSGVRIPLSPPLNGRVAERLMAPDSKSGVVERLPWVQILLLPPHEGCMQEKVVRPWGYFVVIKKVKGSVVKKIVVKPGKRLSLQSHRYRSEIWVVMSGEGKAANGKVKNGLVPSTLISRGSIVEVQRGHLHRLENTSKTKLLKVLEIQKGDRLLESDIIRYEDDYGRV